MKKAREMYYFILVTRRVSRQIQILLKFEKTKRMGEEIYVYIYIYMCIPKIGFARSIGFHRVTAAKFPRQMLFHVIFLCHPTYTSSRRIGFLIRELRATYSSCALA